MQSFLQYRSFGRQISRSITQQRQKKCDVLPRTTAKATEKTTEQATIGFGAGLFSTQSERPSRDSQRIDAGAQELQPSPGTPDPNNTKRGTELTSPEYSRASPPTDHTITLEQTLTQRSTCDAFGFSLFGVSPRERTTREGKGSQVFMVG